MSNESEHIEERLIPFIEGLLNPSEHQDVVDAIAANEALAQEVQDLRDIVVELREAFASGVTVPQPEVPVEDVVLLASHVGSLDSMPGSSLQKTRLFLNDQALDEFHLLRSLNEDMLQSTLAIEDVPAMPASIRAEFKRLNADPKVLFFEGRPTHSTPSKPSFFDRINPRPLMAVAAVFAVVTLGVHFSNTSTDTLVATSTTESQNQQPESTLANAGSSPRNGAQQPQKSAGGKAPESLAVTVFTSPDRDLLKEQANKLLAQKVRHTVTDDKITVPVKEVEIARQILWGDEASSGVAVAEKGQESQSLRYRKPKENEGAAPPSGARDYPVGAGNEAEASSPTDDAPLKTYYYRSTPKPDPDSSLDEMERDRDIPKPVESRSADGDAGSLDPISGRSGVASSPEPVALPQMPPKSDSAQERKDRLKGLALGKDEDADADATDDVLRTEINRARVAAPPAAEPKPAPVANVITGGISADLENTPKNARSGPSSAGSVAMEDSISAPGAAVAPPRAIKKTTAANGGESAASADNAVDSRQQPGGSDLRLAGARRSQAEVARRYNVVLAIESDGQSIKVYVEPREDMTKSALDELKRAVRADLGLSPEDTIVIR